MIGGRKCATPAALWSLLSNAPAAGSHPTATRHRYGKLDALWPSPRLAPSLKCNAALAARLVVVLARAHLADRLLDVVRKLEAARRDQLLPLLLSGDRVELRLRRHVLALRRKVGRVHVAVRQEDRHAVLGLAADCLELLHEAAEAVALLHDILRRRVVGAGRERARLESFVGLLAQAVLKRLPRHHVRLRRRDRGARQLLH